MFDTANIEKSVHDAMVTDFHRMSPAEQLRKIMLAGNAEFVLRMTDGVDQSTEVGKTVSHIREALTRLVPPM